MSWAFAFCPVCKTDRCFYTVPAINIAAFQGKRVSFFRKDCFCEVCGAPVYSKEINEENFANLLKVMAELENGEIKR